MSELPFTCSAILRHDKAFGHSVGSNHTVGRAGGWSLETKGCAMKSPDKVAELDLFFFFHRKNNNSKKIRTPRRGQVFRWTRELHFLGTGCREMFPWFRTHWSCRDLSPVPATNVGWLTRICNSSSRGTWHLWLATVLMCIYPPSIHIIQQK